MLYSQGRHVRTEDAGQTLQEEAKLTERFLQLLLTSTAVALPGGNRALGPPLAPRQVSIGSPDAVQHLYSPLTYSSPIACPGKNHSRYSNKFWSSDTDHLQGIAPMLEPSASALHSQTGACFFFSALKYCRYNKAFIFYPSSALY